ncbi:hypothetical protein [Paraliomyxa miuraensis]|uniref:hypothetical protein n=1 Tax=Paraliomyxa miuraensis TaxID=376150 RepID=UPI00224FAE40|nr:hypothetical protein [Paraliomyxa miuraensis]
MLLDELELRERQAAGEQAKGERRAAEAIGIVGGEGLVIHEPALHHRPCAIEADIGRSRLAGRPLLDPYLPVGLGGDDRRREGLGRHDHRRPRLLGHADEEHLGER